MHIPSSDKKKEKTILSLMQKDKWMNKQITPKSRNSEISLPDVISKATATKIFGIKSKTERKADQLEPN